MLSHTVTSRSPVHCTLHVRVMTHPLDPVRLTQVISQLDQPCILGGHDTPLPGNQMSYWAANPVDTLTLNPDKLDVVETLKAALNRYSLGKEDLPEDLPPFCCGWMGYFSYDLGTHFEPMPTTTCNDLHMPLAELGFYDRCMAWHAASQTVYLMALEMENEATAPASKLDSLATLLNACESTIVPVPQPGDLDCVEFSAIKRNMTQIQYTEAIGKIKQYLIDGDTYQINLSHRFELPFKSPPVSLFHWQNRFNPSPYSAYLDVGAFKIVSASPEMFLTLNEGHIQTKPIKGTRARLNDADHPDLHHRNVAAIQDLLNSPKEQAELNMIIDLERNDLARICIPGTRTVTQPRTLETYATVYHAAATVGGRIKPGLDFCDILQATFPGGSITGAPKIRSMQIIDETEPTARGAYTGSIGFVSINHNACLNIAIRTIIIARNTAYVQAGGGIVADSQAPAEYEETLTKARALIAGILAVAKNQVED
jgi:para-aminobenzoate synthetase component 1